jgi:hypothetical protein
VILFHISSRYLDLAPILGTAAAAANLASVVGSTETTPAGMQLAIMGSEVAAMARSVQDLGSLAAPHWRPLLADPTVREWTDDYSNVLAAMLRRLLPPQP